MRVAGLWGAGLGELACAAFAFLRENIGKLCFCVHGPMAVVFLASISIAQVLAYM